MKKADLHDFIEVWTDLDISMLNHKDLFRFRMFLECGIHDVSIEIRRRHEETSKKKKGALKSAAIS